MFSQNLLATLNSAFIPAAYANDGYVADFILQGEFLYYNGYKVAQCTHGGYGYFSCTNNTDFGFGGYADPRDYNSYTFILNDSALQNIDKIMSGAIDRNAFNSFYGDNAGDYDYYADNYDDYDSYDDYDNYDSGYDSGSDSYDSDYDSYDSGYDNSYDGSDSYDDYDDDDSNAGTTEPVATGNTFYQYKTTPTGLSGKESYFTDYSNTTAIKTKDNTVYYFANGGKEIFIDVNSTKRGPNAGGRDIFYFQKLDRDNSNPAYRIKPYDGGEGYTCDKDNVSIGCTEKLLSEGKMNY